MTNTTSKRQPRQAPVAAGVAGAFFFGGVDGELEVSLFGSVAAGDVVHPVAGAGADGGEEGLFAEGFVPEFGAEFDVAEVI